MRLLTKMRDNWCAGEYCMCPVCSYCFNWGENEAKLRRNWGEQTYNATTSLWSKMMKAWHALVSGTARYESSSRSATTLVRQSDNISRLKNVRGGGGSCGPPLYKAGHFERLIPRGSAWTWLYQARPCRWMVPAINLSVPVPVHLDFGGDVCKRIDLAPSAKKFVFDPVTTSISWFGSRLRQICKCRWFCTSISGGSHTCHLFLVPKADWRESL